jgi:hypothetical protein
MMIGGEAVAVAKLASERKLEAKGCGSEAGLE